MLKKYIVNGKVWQYEEGTQPEGAIEKAVTPPNKAKKAANKSRKAKTK